MEVARRGAFSRLLPSSGSACTDKKSTRVWISPCDVSPGKLVSMLPRKEDKPTVMVEYEKQGHEWATRWTASYETEEWKALLARAYCNFTEDDEGKFVQWLHQAK